jgi:hypothetical protein
MLGSPPHTTVPPDMTVPAIHGAKIEKLKWWISRANETAKACGEKKNPLTKGGNANDLRRKIAEYFGLDLSATTVVESTAAKKGADSESDTLRQTIQKRQWAHLRALGSEWKDCAEKKVPFALCEQGKLQEAVKKRERDLPLSLEASPVSSTATCSRTSESC